MNNYYIIIPSFVIQNENLKLVDIVVYGHIRRYVDMRECFISNFQLSKEVGIGLSCLKSSLMRLEKNNIIVRNVHYKEGTKQIIKRTITLVGNSTSDVSIQKLSTEIVDNSSTLGLNCNPTLGLNCNPGSNKKKNNKKKEKKEKEKKESLACASSKAAQASLSNKQADLRASRSVKKHSINNRTTTAPKRSHASTNAASVSSLANKLEHKIKQAQESANPAAALKHLLL